MIRAIAALVLALAAALPAAAQDLPALHDVTGVAEGDVLNVRTGPTTAQPVLGTLAPGARGIEIVRTNPAGTWGQLNIDGREGWASLAFLTPRPDGALPGAPAFRCFGTEPFWSLDVRQNGPATFRTPDGENLDLRARPLLTARGHTGRFGLTASAPGTTGSLVMRTAACSDGMSDQRFGLTADLLFTGNREELLSGCCTLAGN